MRIVPGDRMRAPLGDPWTLSPTADVIVADYANGVAAALGSRHESRGPHAPRVLILASVDREWEITAALEQGVRGYMLMGCALDDLAGAIRAVHRGDRHLSAQIAARLAESIAIERLTVREEEVLQLVASGLCNKAISRCLGIAVGTVKSHLKSAFEKLDVRSRTQAIVTAERRGLLRDRVASDRPEAGARASAPISARAHGAMA